MRADPPPIAQIWRWLADVPDPEIPVMSVVDLGVVREVAWDRDTLTVAVTPTYSGCPATRVIEADIEQALRARGLEKLRVVRRLSPAWSTADMTPAAHEKLRAYGVAPPVESGGDALPIVACPRCESTRTERVSQFGSTPCKAFYRCRDCLEPFDYFKCLR